MDASPYRAFEERSGHHAPLVVLISGLCGCTAATRCGWASVIAYPVYIGGKPLHSRRSSR